MRVMRVGIHVGSHQINFLICFLHVKFSHFSTFKTGRSWYHEDYPKTPNISPKILEIFINNRCSQTTDCQNYKEII